MATFLVTFYVFINQIDAHSWTRCVDYQAQITGLDYDESQCNGWLRGWEFNDVLFGLDRGIDHQIALGEGGQLCQSALSGSADNNYGRSNMNKIPQYTSGNTIKIVWPAKNHANYECFQYIPDTELKLYMNPNTNPIADIPNTGSSMEEMGYKLVKNWHDGCTPGTDGCGFQNCPKFCENTDKATCFGDFVVPNVEISAFYTFVWYWIFNKNTPPYISCFEAYVSSSGHVPLTPSPVSVSTPSPSTPSPIPQQCGYVPESCNPEIHWALDSGRWSKPEWYPNFESVTGVKLELATFIDVALYWKCTNNPHSVTCAGLQIPCDRQCKSVPTASPTLPMDSDGYCSWNKCNGIVEGGPWCNQGREICLACGPGAEWCDASSSAKMKSDPLDIWHGLNEQSENNQGEDNVNGSEESHLLVYTLIIIIIALLAVINCFLCFRGRRNSKYGMPLDLSVVDAEEAGL